MSDPLAASSSPPQGSLNNPAPLEGGTPPSGPPPPPKKIGLNLLLGLWPIQNHLEERLLDQAQARASYTPLFWGRSRSIPQCMVSNV